MSTELTEQEREEMADELGAELYEAVMESSADQWRRWRYLTDFAKEQYRAEAERIIVDAFMPAVERIVAAREKALAERIAQAIEAELPPIDPDSARIIYYRAALIDAARLAREGEPR